MRMKEWNVAWMKIRKKMGVIFWIMNEFARSQANWFLQTVSRFSFFQDFSRKIYIQDFAKMNVKGIKIRTYHGSLAQVLDSWAATC